MCAIYTKYYYIYFYRNNFYLSHLKWSSDIKLYIWFVVTLYYFNIKIIACFILTYMYICIPTTYLCVLIIIICLMFKNKHILKQKKEDFALTNESGWKCVKKLCIKFKLKFKTKIITNVWKIKPQTENL